MVTDNCLWIYDDDIMVLIMCDEIFWLLINIIDSIISLNSLVQLGLIKLYTRINNIIIIIIIKLI